MCQPTTIGGGAFERSHETTASMGFRLSCL